MSKYDILINDFAIRSFRDTADSDYIAARLSLRASLVPQFLWQSLQTLEKYLKCILVLNRIRAPKSHSLSQLLTNIEGASRFEIRMSDSTHKFIEYLDTYGRFRYYETPYYTYGDELFLLDKAVWEIRRYARIMDFTVTFPDGQTIEALPHELQKNEKAESRSPQKFLISGGYLEKIIAKRNHPSRLGLVWHNLYFGSTHRRTVRHKWSSVAGNSPLSLHPEILDEVLKYVWLPNEVKEAYRRMALPSAAATQRSSSEPLDQPR